MPNGKIVGDEACPTCRAAGRDKTGNHLMVFEDGGKYCNRCGHTEAVTKADEEADALEADANITMDNAATLPIRGVESRGLSQHVMEKYGHRVTINPQSGEVDRIVYPRYRQGRLVGYKVRVMEGKKFYALGDTKECDLVGQNLEGGRKWCIITEGEDDAVAAHQMLLAENRPYRVVSLPTGSSVNITKYSHEWLSEFETIIIATDMDDKGEEAANKIAELFAAGVCKRATLPHKDANDCLLAGDGKAFVGAIMTARTVTAAGVVMGQDTWDRVLGAYRDPQGGGIPFPDFMQKTNEAIYGMKTSSLDTFTSGTGAGKTQLLRELQYHLAVVHNEKVGTMSLEEPMEDAALGQMSIAANKPLHLPDVRPTVTDDELRTHWQATYGTGNYVVYDHFGSLDGNSLISKIRYLAVAMGCKYIVLDHLSIVVSEYADEGDERKTIDKIMTKLKNLTQELGIWIGLVVHLRKAGGGKSFEEGAIPSLDDLRGSGSIKQLSNHVIATARNQQADDEIMRDTTLITILKARSTGRTGPSDVVYYDRHTGRMEQSPTTVQEWRDGGIKMANKFGD